MLTNLVPKVPKLFTCIFCDYSTSRKSQYDRHILTSKHINDDAELQKNLQNLQKFTCGCGNIYKYRQGLWTHKKKCLIKDY